MLSSSQAIRGEWTGMRMRQSDHNYILSRKVYVEVLARARRVKRRTSGACAALYERRRPLTTVTAAINFAWLN